MIEKANFDSMLLSEGVPTGSSFLYKGFEPTDSAERLKASGYEVKRLNLQKLQGTSYNPFAYIRTDADIVQISDILANQIAAMHNGRRDTGVVSLLSAFIAYLYHRCSKESQNMTAVVQMIRDAQIKEDDMEFTSPVDALFDYIENKETDFAYVQYEVARGISYSMFHQTLAIAADGLTAFNVKAMQELTNKDNMNMQNAKQGRTAIFVTPSNCQYFNILNEILEYQAKENGMVIFE